MPIDIEQFEQPTDLGPPTTSERIVRFLLSHEDRAYTRSEIADALGVSPETIGTNLTRLKARGLVRHREPYWAFTDDHEHARAVLHERGFDDLVTLLSASTREDSRAADSGSRGRPVASDAGGSHREAASAFVDHARSRLADAIEACYVFGSVARGTESTTSDVDVLVVVADEVDFRTVDEQLLEIAFDVQLTFDVRVEVHPMPASEFERRRDRGEPFVRTIVEEGVRSE